MIKMKRLLFLLMIIICANVFAKADLPFIVNAGFGLQGEIGNDAYYDSSTFSLKEDASISLFLPIDGAYDGHGWLLFDYNYCFNPLYYNTDDSSNLSWKDAVSAYSDYHLQYYSHAIRFGLLGGDYLVKKGQINQMFALGAVITFVTTAFSQINDDSSLSFTEHDLGFGLILTYFHRLFQNWFFNLSASLDGLFFLSIFPFSFKYELDNWDISNKNVALRPVKPIIVGSIKIGVGYAY